LREARAGGTYLENPTNFIEAFLQKIDKTKEEDPQNDIYCGKFCVKSLKFSKPSVSIFLKKLYILNSDENLISVLYDFFFGAAETTENILSYGILYLILNPDIQNKIFEEIKSVVGLTRWPLQEDREK